MTLVSRLFPVALAAALFAAPDVHAAADPTSEAVVKAAFLYNFAKFTEWPSRGSDASLTLCVVGDPQVAAALLETARSQRIGAHPVEAKAMASDALLHSCDLLFISSTETRRAATMLDSLSRLPVLTVSDGRDFARSGGTIELFVESGRMRFLINTDAADRAGVRLSSRLLSLAKIVRGDHAP